MLDGGSGTSFICFDEWLSPNCEAHAGYTFGLFVLMNCLRARFDWQVEIQVRKVYCINRAMPTLPINLEDAARSEAEFEKAEQVFVLSFASLLFAGSTQLLFPSCSYFLSMILMVLLWCKRFTLAMVADRREAGACSPGHTLELSSYRSANTRQSSNLPYPVPC